MPVKQGMLFSDDEHKMDVDVQKTSGLTASAKITLFEVEVIFQFTLFSQSIFVCNCDAKCENSASF